MLLEMFFKRKGFLSFILEIFNLYKGSGYDIKQDEGFK